MGETRYGRGGAPFSLAKGGAVGAWPPLGRCLGTPRPVFGRVSPGHGGVHFRKLLTWVLPALLLMGVATAGAQHSMDTLAASQGALQPGINGEGGGHGGPSVFGAERGSWAGAGVGGACAGDPCPSHGVQRRVLVEPSKEAPSPPFPLPGRVLTEQDQEALTFPEPGFIPGSLLRLKMADGAQLRQRVACLGQDGAWVYEPQPRPLPWNVDFTELCDRKWVELGGGRMSGPSADAVTDPSSWRVRESLKYRWQPRASCGSWLEFARPSFCATLEQLGGHLLVVGDSLSRYFFNSLHNHLEMADRTQRTHKTVPPQCKLWEDMGLMPRHLKLCRAFKPCATDVHVYHLRNDWLTTDIAEPRNISDNYFLPWLPFIRAAGIRAVLLNRGAHFVASPLFEQQLEATMKALRAEHPGLLVFYRGTAGGHAGCDSYSGPISEPLKGPPHYHAAMFPAQNAAAREIVERHRGVYLNVETMSLYRPDGHFGTHDGITDCLHYCNPGPVDDWVRLFFNAWIQIL